MARGWESKSIEDQMESFASRGGSSSKEQQLSPGELERQRQKESLLLSRTRVLHDLEESHNQRHRDILKRSLAYLDGKLAEFG